MGRLVFKPGAVQLFATNQAAKSVRITTSAVTRQAKRNAPGGLYSTGRLKASINWSIQTAGWNVRGTSGSDLPWAIFPEQGTRPHTIRAKNAPHLTFYWRRVGRVVRFREVSHPGQKAQNYLTNALSEIAPRYGYKVVIYG